MVPGAGSRVPGLLLPENRKQKKMVLGTRCQVPGLLLPENREQKKMVLGTRCQFLGRCYPGTSTREPVTEKNGPGCLVLGPRSFIPENREQKKMVLGTRSQVLGRFYPGTGSLTTRPTNPGQDNCNNAPQFPLWTCWMESSSCQAIS
jgi:hypothetical protein